MTIPSKTETPSAAAQAASRTAGSADPHISGSGAEGSLEGALTRMANEMFGDVPGGWNSGAVTPAIPPALPQAIPHSLSETTIPKTTAYSGIGFPEHQQLRALLTPLVSSSTISAPRSIPAALPTGSILPNPGPAYYFLKDADAQISAPATLQASPGEFKPELVLAPNNLRRPFNVQAIRGDFPILEEVVNGKRLVWLDNAATTHKPRAVIDRLVQFYEHENSNIHRAAHELAARSTDAYEGAREKVARFLNASSHEEIVFVRGATEAINLVAQSWGRQNVRHGDEILITWLEHHANIVPWQQLAAEKGARLHVAPVDNDGQILLDEYQKLLSPRTRIVAFPQVSNALGTITPAREMVEIAHRYGARVLVDGAQAVSHMPVDVQAMNADWYVFSGHKVFAPTGIGVLFGKQEVLDSTLPWQGGGNMIQDVTFDKTIYQSSPARFEAGTGNIADAVGLGAAIDYLELIGVANVGHYEHDLLVYATRALESIPGLRLIGTAREKAGVLSFVLGGFDTLEVGHALAHEGIAVRAGHHCAQPILRRFGVESTVRPSLALYNTYSEIDCLVDALREIQSGTNILAH